MIRKHERLTYAAPALVFLIVTFVYPLYLLVEMAHREVSIGTVRFIGTAQNDTINPRIGLANFRAVLESPDFQHAVPRTVYFVATSVALQLLLGLALAVVLTEQLPGVRINRALVFFIWLLPPVVHGAIWKTILWGDSSGVANWIIGKFGQSPIAWLSDPSWAFAAIILVNAWAGAPFVAIVLMAAIQNVPIELSDAARVDGAPPARRFLSVTLPTIRPVIAIVSLLLIIYAFKTFDYIYVLTQGGPGTSTETIPYFAFDVSFVQRDFGQGAAVAIIAVVVSLVASLPYVLRSRAAQ